MRTKLDLVDATGHPTWASVDSQMNRAVSSFAEFLDELNRIGRRRKLIERDHAAVRPVHHVM